MNEEGKFWIYLWAIFVIGIVMLTSLVALYNIDYNEKITEMVNNGTSPMAAVCGLSDIMGDNPICVILATKGEE